MKLKKGKMESSYSESDIKPGKGTWVWIVSGLVVAIVTMAKVIREEDQRHTNRLYVELRRKDSIISSKNVQIENCTTNAILNVKKQLEDIKSIDNALDKKSQLIDKEITETQNKIKQYN